MECHFKNTAGKCSGDIFMLNDCNSDIGNHLKTINQSNAVKEVKDERALILTRAGIFGRDRNICRRTHICSSHRNVLGLQFRAKRTCQHPGHTGTGKPEKGRSFSYEMSKEIQEVTGGVTLVVLGEGNVFMFSNCIFKCIAIIHFMISQYSIAYYFVATL